MVHLKILIFMSEIQLNNNFSNLNYPVLTKNFISYGGLWYNINCIFEILQQIHQKALQIRQYKKKKQLCMKPPDFLVNYLNQFWVVVLQPISPYYTTQNVMDLSALTTLR